MMIKFVKSKYGDIFPFDITKVESSLFELFNKIPKYNVLSQENKDVLVDKIIVKFKENLEKENEKISIEDNYFLVDQIEDFLEKTLMELSLFDIAKKYILERINREEESKRIKELSKKELDNNSLFISKRNGNKELFSLSKIRRTFNKVSFGLANYCKFNDFKESLLKYLVPGIKSSDINKLLIKTSIDLISVQNTKWEFIAGRLLLLQIYKESGLNRNINVLNPYSGKNYLELFNNYIEKGFYFKDFYKYYDKKDIVSSGEYIDKNRDFDYNYNTMLLYKKRYLLNPNKVINELPQEMYMSIALFLAIPEKKEDRLKIAFKIYDYCSKGMISLPTPTLLNARTNFHQLSSCFKLNIDDDLRAIYHGIENMAQISKFGGGIGVYLGNIRSKGGTIRGIKGTSLGVNPWVKVINDTAIAVNQLGARAGSISVTLDMWHRDIYDFLDLQTETGDIRRKSFDIFPAISIPNLFMKRVENNEDWTLFDPKELKDITGKSLQDLFGEDFDKFYIECENNKNLELKEKTKAKELFKRFLKSTVETGMPYVFFRDTVNDLNPNKHVGNIYSTQLCTEICQNTSPSKFIEETIDDGIISIKYIPGDSVVCNLASINIAKVNDQKTIEEVTPIAMKILDNVIDLNFYPIKESEITAKKYRSVGLGFLGLAEYLANNKLSYESKEAREIVDKMMEKFAYETLKESNNLAKERGYYSLFKGSEWDKGILFGKNKSWFKENSNISEQWVKLIDDIKKDGLRFAYHIAPAPNTSTSLVIGTTAALLPIYKKYFIETNGIAPILNVAPNLNNENFWYYKEYINMNMYDVIDMISIIYKWVDQSISFEWMIDPAKVSPKELYEYYLKAHKQGIKTVYYVRSMSLDVKECVSCSG